ncbi:MAG: hypothetical protein F6K50_25110 [Moorea sp. SIO3I7]|nr:hypothetical protein [Moorena sp. SIO3I7]
MEWKKPTSHVQENEAGIELQTECLGLCKIHDAEQPGSRRSDSLEAITIIFDLV